MDKLFFICFVLVFLQGCHNDLEKKAKMKEKANYILVEKSKRKMSLFNDKNLVKTYNIAIGKEPEGHKEREGDNKTPEGIYTIAKKNPKSKYHRALQISYPNALDRENARKKGHHPGGDIMIHGLEPHFWWVGPHHQLQDLTRGCIAVSNPEITEIYDLTPIGTRIEIIP